MLQRKTSSAKSAPIPKHVLLSKLSRAWSRVCDGLDGGKHEMAAKLSVHTDTIGNALSAQRAPEALTVINSVTVDPTALDEVFRELGFCLIPLQTAAANDLQTAAGVVSAMGDLIARLADGIRCHNDTLAVATMLRPHMPALEAIVTEADRLRA
jgi:hypothetical protein